MKKPVKSFRIYVLILVLAVAIPLTSYGQSESEVTFEKSMVIDANSPSLVWGPCPEFMPDGCEIAVLHGDPAKPNVDILFKLPANTDIPMHWHNSAERMVLLTGELMVTYQGEQVQTINQGNYAYGPAKKPHSGKCGDAGPCILFIGFEHPLDAMPINK